MKTLSSKFGLSPKFTFGKREERSEGTRPLLANHLLLASAGAPDLRVGAGEWAGVCVHCCSFI